MTKHDPEARITRRDLLARLVAFGLSLTGSRALAQAGRPFGSAGARAVPWDDRFELAITLHIQGPGRRPYVAVFLEDEAGTPVCTVRLWVQKARRRWIADLRHWFRQERDRRAAGGSDLIATVSSPTRQAGRYTVRWNGRDDAGRPVEQGVYQLCVETVRQGGGNHLVRQAFTFGTTPFQATLDGSNPDISEVSVEYRQRADS